MNQGSQDRRPMKRRLPRRTAEKASTPSPAMSTEGTKSPRSMPKRVLSLLAAAMPHLLLILSGMLLTFCIIDFFNSAMGFLDNEITKGIQMALCGVSFITAGMLIYHQRRGR